MNIPFHRLGFCRILFLPAEARPLDPFHRSDILQQAYSPVEHRRRVRTGQSTCAIQLPVCTPFVTVDSDLLRFFWHDWFYDKVVFIFCCTKQVSIQLARRDFLVDKVIVVRPIFGCWWSTSLIRIGQNVRITSLLESCTICLELNWNIRLLAQCGILWVTLLLREVEEDRGRHAITPWPASLVASLICLFLL